MDQRQGSVNSLQSMPTIVVYIWTKSIDSRNTLSCSCRSWFQFQNRVRIIMPASLIKEIRSAPRGSPYFQYLIPRANRSEMNSNVSKLVSNPDNSYEAGSSVRPSQKNNSVGYSGWTLEKNVNYDGVTQVEICEWLPLWTDLDAFHINGPASTDLHARSNGLLHTSSTDTN